VTASPWPCPSSPNRRAFPARSAFLVAVEQPLVTATGGADIESALGDLTVRLRARILGKRHVLWGLGSLGTGTGDDRLFPYSSQSRCRSHRRRLLPKMSSSHRCWMPSNGDWSGLGAAGG